MQETKPLLAITMGDPAGCGPEVIAKAATSGDVQRYSKLLCVGDCEVMRRAFKIIGTDMDVIPVTDLNEVRLTPNCLNVLDLENVDLETLRVGEIQESAGQAAFEYIVRGIDLALEGVVDAVVTAPISKEALHLAGHRYDGHTELFAQRTGAKDVTMMLASGHFRVTHVSTHVSLRNAVDLCTHDRLLKVITLTKEGLQHMGISEPRLAVAGLNPHSGEGGLFGSEEIDIIQPTIDAAIKERIDVYPHPVPPDTVFVRMLENKEFDGVITQYHDQGHIAAKIVDFWGSVNITLGLPIIRTSVDHGTAFDIAGTGKANPESLVNAIKYACTMHAHWPD
jgi:4-hydroxythreonine-4-phosphate dehydrogenase